MNHFIYIDKILAIRTNLDKFAWSYGSVAPKSTYNKYKECKIKIIIDVRNNNKVFDDDFKFDEYFKYHYYFAKENNNKIYYERSLLGGIKLRYSIEIKGNDICVIVSKTYMKYIKHRIMGLHSMSCILTDLVSAVLLRNGYATTYCSAVNKGDKSLLIFSPPNTGKTITSIRLCKDHGYKFMSEDFALTDGQSVWAVPWTSTFRYYGNSDKSKKGYLIDRIINMMPIFNLLPIRKKKSICSYLGSNIIIYTSSVSNIVVLERGHSKIDNNREIGMHKIKNLQRYLLYYYKSPVLIAMDYFNSEFSLEKLIEVEREIIIRLVNKCDYMCLCEDNALKYSDVISERITFSVP